VLAGPGPARPGKGVRDTARSAGQRDVESLTGAQLQQQMTRRPSADRYASSGHRLLLSFRCSLDRFTLLYHRFLCLSPAPLHVRILLIRLQRDDILLPASVRWTKYGGFS